MKSFLGGTGKDSSQFCVFCILISVVESFKDNEVRELSFCRFFLQTFSFRRFSILYVTTGVSLLFIFDVIAGFFSTAGSLDPAHSNLPENVSNLLLSSIASKEGGGVSGLLENILFWEDLCC